MNLHDNIILMMYISIYVCLFIKMVMTTYFVFLALNLELKKSSGTEPLGHRFGFIMLIRFMR